MTARQEAQTNFSRTYFASSQSEIKTLSTSPNMLRVIEDTSSSRKIPAEHTFDHERCDVNEVGEIGAVGSSETRK